MATRRRIHKAQGLTVDRTHVLATPGMDAHGSYADRSAPDTQRDAALRRGLRIPSHWFTEPNGLKSTRDSAHRWMKEWAQSYKSEGRAPVSHQKQRERNATKAIKPERKRRKINKAGR